MKLRRLFLWLLIASVLATASLGAASAMGWDDIVEWEMVSTAITLGIFCVGALIALSFIKKRRSPRLAHASIWSGLAATIAILALLWALDLLPWRYEQWFNQVSLSLSMLALYLLALAFVTSEPVLTLVARIIRLSAITFGTIGVVVLMSFIISFELFDVGDWQTQEVLSEVAGLSVLLGLAGTALLPILGRLARANDESQHEKTLGERTPIRIACPRCDQEQSVRAGASKCSGCGLRFTIDFEEPRCECGYLLYGLRGETCPECGQNITQSQRWDEESAKPENGDSSAAPDSSKSP